MRFTIIMLDRKVNEVTLSSSMQANVLPLHHSYRFMHMAGARGRGKTSMESGCTCVIGLDYLWMEGEDSFI